MEFTKKVVDDLAEKLLIGLTEEENKMVLEEFEIIDQNINVINHIPNIDKVEPMSHCLDDFIYELREDTDDEGGTVLIEDVLSNCDDHINREVRVPKVVK